MKKNGILITIISLFLAVAAISAQEKTTNFSGTWELDSGKSKLGERTRVESVTMVVSQTGKDLKVEKTTKRALRNESGIKGGTPNAGGMPEGMGRPVSGSFTGGDMKQSLSYSLEGKETKDEIPGIPGASSTLKARWEKGGKLTLSTIRKAGMPPSETTITENETWSLSADGKVLTIVLEQDAQRGRPATEMVFVKK